MNTSAQVKKELTKYANSEKVKFLSRFFKTGKGEYGEGDKFIGIKVPDQRIVAKQFQDISLKEVEKLLNSKIHEHRLTGLLILVLQYQKIENKKEIVNFYLAHTDRVNNWDLVDSTAHKILGAWLLNKKDRKILYKLAESKNLWEQRISVVATWTLINNKQFNDICKIAKKLLHHKHDLMHKAIGWMLREMGKQDINQLLWFLNECAHKMPRTMLRYSIEKLSQKDRKYYMSLKHVN